MSDFLSIWLTFGGAGAIVCLLVAIMWALISQDAYDDSYDKATRRIVRNCLLGVPAALLWPITLPVVLCWAVWVTITYAFPRESEE